MCFDTLQMLPAQEPRERVFYQALLHGLIEILKGCMADVGIEYDACGQGPVHTRPLTVCS